MKHVVAVEIETENGNKRLKMHPMEGSREGSNNKLKIVLYEIAHSDNPQRRVGRVGRWSCERRVGEKKFV